MVKQPEYRQPTFKSADVVVLMNTKTHYAVSSDRRAPLDDIRRVAPEAKLIELSVRNSVRLDLLVQSAQAARSGGERIADIQQENSPWSPRQSK
jgi:hypothetical protein